MRSIHEQKSKQALREQVTAHAAFFNQVDAWIARLPPDTILPDSCLPAMRRLALAVVAFRLTGDIRVQAALMDTMHEAVAEIVYLAQEDGLPPMAVAA